MLGAIAVFLVVKAIPSLQQGPEELLLTKAWSPDADPPLFGIAVLAFGTVLSSIIALVLAVPVALGVAIFVVEYAPRRLATWLGYLIDMLATVPSVVYGLWGLIFLVPHIRGFQHFLATTFGWIPLFDDPNNRTSVASRSIFVASVVLAIMVLPVIAAISREVLRQVDPNLKEAALALGATRWEMVRYALLPPSRPGIIGAIMLGLGRALGETIAVALILGTSFAVSIAHLAARRQHDRRQHRQLLRRSRRDRPIGSDRDRAGAVHHDARRQSGGPHGDLPGRRQARCWPMSAGVAR